VPNLIAWAISADFSQVHYLTYEILLVERKKNQNRGRTIRMRLLIFIGFIGLLSCKQKSSTSDSWVKPASITLNCDEYFSLETELGVLNNNVWNKTAAETDAWSQCLEKRMIDSTLQFGWSWSWPTHRRVIYAYPQIKVGSSPWLPEPKFDSRFPLKISKLNELTISYDVEISASGNYNLATTMWLVNASHTGNVPNPNSIAAEIMIWTFATENHFDPAGKKQGEFHNSDRTWEVWLDKEWSDKSIDSKGLLNYAIQENMIPSNLLIADIELGNEVMSGSGLSWIKAFKIDISNDE